MRCTRAVIYGDNLKHNLGVIRSFIQRPQTKLCIAVKADGYGCGAVFTARTAIECGASYLAVATVDEGIELRENGISCPILMLSLCSKDEMESVVRYNITPFVFDREYITALDKAAGRFNDKSKFPVHLAVDTGMGRIGCMPEEAVEAATFIIRSAHLSLEGVCTHCSSADGINDADRIYTRMQFDTFVSSVNAIKKAGIEPGICHCAASAALLDHPEMQLDMVRSGIITYGYYAGQIDREYFAVKGIPCELEPVMSLESEIVSIRPFKAGKYVSYGRTWTVERDTDIAVLPIGYADGLLRRFSPGLTVAINEKSYPVVGRICMDQCMVDIGKNNSDVHRWDKAVFFGPKNSGALQDAEDIARRTGTIAYEIMTGITKRVPRVIV
ncbi:MAG: alanine racemase [Treponema sp.]|nr:alanine racemase [Treponema sp.]